MKVNWLAILVCAIVFFLLGGLWYGVLFGTLWMAQMSKIGPHTGASGWYPFAVTLVTGFFLAYGLARILAWRGEMSAGRGAFIGFSMGLLIFGTMTWMDYAYSSWGVTLGFINIGFVVVGMAVQGAILGAWRPKTG